MREHFVIVGGGQAAVQAAASARQNEYQGKISLIADEAHLPYQRPPLSKTYLAGKLEADRLLLKPEQFYATREIDLRRQTRATSIDPDKSRVQLAGGEQIEFSELLLATGSEPRKLNVPGAELGGIHYLRTIADVEGIREDFRPGARLVIIGAGYIGLEVAAVAVGLGLEVTVLEASAWAMSRTVSPEVAAFYADRHRQAGVDIRFNCSLAAFEGDSTLHGIRTSEGESLECNLAIVAIGILPRTGLGEAMGLEIDNGIAVDLQGRTSRPSVYAAGDCTSHPHPFAGQRIRLESVQNAIEQGKAVAAALCGRDDCFDALPWFWSDQYDLKLQIAGLSQGYDQTITRGDPDTGSFSVFYLASGRVIAVDAVNDPKSFIVARQMLAAKPAWPAAAIADPDFDLKTIGS